MSFILINSAVNFPDGFSHLLQKYFSIAYTKVNSGGTVTQDFTDFTVHLTQLDQRLFWGVLPYQPDCSASVFCFAYAMRKYPDDRRAAIQASVGRYLRSWLELIATAAPLLTAGNFLFRRF